VSISKRVAVPFTQTEVDRLETQLPVLQGDQDVWQRVISLLMGAGNQPGFPIGFGAIVQPPRSVPQLINVLAGVGLRVLEDLQVDLTYDDLGAVLEHLPRAASTSTTTRKRALSADGLRV
jgi:hypothetical protein